MRGNAILVTAAVAALSAATPAAAQPVRADIASGGRAEVDRVAAAQIRSMTLDRAIVADQVLMAVVANAGTGALIGIESGRFETGANRIGDTAFAGFAGILTQSWNSGINANSQAATNVAWGGAGEGLVRFSAGAGDRGNR